MMTERDHTENARRHHAHSCCCVNCTGELIDPDTSEAWEQAANDAEMAAEYELERKLATWEAMQIDNDPFADKPAPGVGTAL